MSLTKITLTGTVDKIRAAFIKVNDIIDDLLSTSAGLGASAIGITDAAANMAATNVEDALAEIYTDTSTVRALGEVFATDSSTTTGLTWGYSAGSVRFDNVITAVAAGTVSLTDNATNYIEIDSAGIVTRNTTAFTTGRIPIRQIVTLAGVQTTSTDKRVWFQSWDMPLPVTKGGSGVATLTDHGILLGSGTEDITPLGVATNGQLPIGSTGADPVLAAPTGTANQITVTLGAGTIALSVPAAFIPPGTVDPVGIVTIINSGLHILDTNASHDLIIKPGSDLTADRILTITTGDAARTISIAGDVTTAGAVSVSAYGATFVDDADAGTALTTLGVSTYAKTLLDDADAATAVVTLGITATAGEINTSCDGSTAKNSHTHDLSTGAADVTATAAQVNTICYGVTEKLKVWTYVHTVTSAEVGPGYFDQAITAVILAKVRGVSICNLLAAGTSVKGGYDSSWELTTTTNMQVLHATDIVENAKFSIIIMEAV